MFVFVTAMDYMRNKPSCFTFTFGQSLYNGQEFDKTIFLQIDLPNRKYVYTKTYVARRAF